MDKTPFIFSQELFQNFVNLLAELFNKKYDASKGEALANTTKSLEDNKVDKEEGKGLSTNDYTNEDKEKLDSLDAGAEKNVITGIYYKNSENLLPVENGYVTVPGVSEEDLPKTLPNPRTLYVYKDSNYNSNYGTSSPSLFYDGATIQSLTAHELFSSKIYSLLPENWNAKQYKITVSGLDINSLIFVSPRPDYMEEYAESGIKAVTYSKNQLNLSCDETPTTRIDIQVIFSSTTRDSDGTPTYL